MAWRGPRTVNDPLLTSHHWRVTVRNHWKDKRAPCARCGRAIDYDGPRFLVAINGKRRQNPRYLHVGHIVDRYLAKRYGWTEAEINAISNTQPEHAACSNRSGAKLGQKVQRAKHPTMINTASRW